ncbi:MAG: NAD(P)-dependent oxidoreductase [Candidatus Methanoperedens sp.]|nr:NAD(P)-dependent oxidoreductase [Candidatus Methanoperedens sp.]
MKILVTGSSGLIGSAVCPLLEEYGYIVRRFDIQPPSSEIGTTYFRSKELTDGKDRRRAIKGIDGVIHLAAVSRVLDAELDPSKCIDVNVRGTMELLHDIAKLDNPPWVIYGSSREVYGTSSKIPVSEDQPLKPVNIYGMSKVVGEYLVSNYSRLTKRPSVIFRFSNVYGSVYDHSTRVIPAFVRATVTGSAIRIEGEDNIFDFTHVDDTANAIRAAVNLIEDGRLAGTEVMNVASGRGTTLMQLANLVRTISGVDIPIIKKKLRDFDVNHFIGDPYRLESLLGVRCKIPLYIGIQRLLNDFRTDINRTGYITEIPGKMSRNMINAVRQEVSL